jgi:hypothetical protein
MSSQSVALNQRRPAKATKIKDLQMQRRVMPVMVFVFPACILTDTGWLFRQMEDDADSDQFGHLFQSISDSVPGYSDSCRSEATLCTDV